MGSERYSNHHHSVSDGVLSYSGSPDNIQAPRWTSPVKKFNLGGPASSIAGGSRSQASWFPHSTERRYAVRGTAASPSFGSPSSLSESSQWESTSERPFPNFSRNLPSRRSYMSKAVYPVVFHNPVSDCDAGDIDTNSVGRLTPSDDYVSPSHWLDNSSSIVQKFHKTLTELHRWEESPEPGASSRRDGFRWSSASSFDGVDGERFDISENIDVESLRSPIGSATDLKCRVCGKLLCQKSPWSSHRIMRGGDMPIAGVLPCSHVFHAECLEQLTPKTQIHEPPCPLCLKSIADAEESSSVSEPLHMALRTIQRNKGIVLSDRQGNDSNNEASKPIRKILTRNWSRAASQPDDHGSSMKKRLRKHFTFKGKATKDLFSSKALQRFGSASSSKEPIQRQISLG